MAKISFDMDSTASQSVVQEFAKFLIKEGHEIWIVTSRMDKQEWNKDLYRIANEMGIPRTRIYFTNGDYKWKFFKDKDFAFHFDDDFMEIQMAKENHCKTLFFPVYDPEDVIEQI